MAKIADRYYKVDPWKIIEEGFNPEYALVSESIFSLGNEYMGIRGYFEEGYSGKRLQGSYQNGVYERRKAPAEGYKGIVQEMEFMVNSVDNLYLRIKAGGEVLDLNHSKFSEFERTLDLKSGLMERSFLWETSQGKIRLTFSRLISMKRNELGVQRLQMESLDFKGQVTVQSGFDFGTFHGEGDLHWNMTAGSYEEGKVFDLFRISARTKVTKIPVESIGKHSGSLRDSFKKEWQVLDDKTLCQYKGELHPGETYTLDKTFLTLTPMSEIRGNEEEVLGNTDFEAILRENRDWWTEVWEKSDIEIFGDDENQQGIRFCIFQMYQTYHGAVPGSNIGAKGLTGEAYNGNAFWDTETYCLPFYLFHNPDAAKNLLYFRYATLDEARERAKALDCKGAFYPIATISGRECCNLWQHASLQLQASTAVAYGIWIYERVTGDQAFTKKYGFEMLAEISRMLVSRGDYDGDHKFFGFYGVMGPDEFQMMVNHNAYTNYMGKFTLEFACQVYDRMKKECSEEFLEIQERIGLQEQERKVWEQIASDMYLPYDQEKGVFEQHQGFFSLPHIDVDSIPVEEFPLYNHWTYDRIYRNDMIKQPDVLMFLLLFNSQFDTDLIRRNYDYYEPKCIHESSLSPSVHSILAEQLGKTEEAFDFFGFATRMDLDNYNRNSGEGLHTTSIAAAWMNIVFGFGGLRADGARLQLNPKLPEQWEGYRFRIVYEGEVLEVTVDQKGVALRTIGGGEIHLLLKGQDAVIKGEMLRI